MYHLFSYYPKGSVGIDFDDGRRFVWTVILAPEAAYIIGSVQDGVFYLVEETRRRMSADVRRGGDNRMLQLLAQRLAERLSGDADADAAVSGNEVRRQVPGIRIDDGQRFCIIAGVFQILCTFNSISAVSGTST